MVLLKKMVLLVVGLLPLIVLPESARGASYPLPFDPFVAGENFGCKRLIVPGAEILPHDPVIDPRTLPGFREVLMKDGKNRTIESLAIKGSRIVRKKDKDGRAIGDPLLLIPSGGLVYDATPLETHLPVGDQGVLFGKTAVLEKKDLAEETCRDFSVLAGRSFPVGDSVITYLMPGPRGGPLVLWRTVDGVSVRPHPLDLYPAGKVPPKTSTRIFGVYTHAGQIVEFQSFSAPYIQKEVWRIDGKKQTITADALWFPHFRIVPVSCPIGHHIGLMVTNDVPILLDPEHPMKLFGGYLTIQLVRADSKSGTVLFSLNGRSYMGTRGIDGLFGTGRAITGIRHTLDTLKKLEGGT